MITYRFTMDGTAADGQTWRTNGEVSAEQAGDFPLLLEQAQRDSFMQLTRGKAVFGKPGVGCRGPYSIKKFLFELVDERERLREIARGNVERHLGDVTDGDASPDSIYTEALTLAHDALIDAKVDEQTAAEIAREVAQSIAQP